MLNFLAIALIQIASFTTGTVQKPAALQAPTTAISSPGLNNIDGGTGGWGGDVATIDGGTGGWGGDVAMIDGGTGGWGGDVAAIDGGTGGWGGDVAA